MLVSTEVVFDVSVVLLFEPWCISSCFTNISGGGGRNVLLYVGDDDDNDDEEGVKYEALQPPSVVLPPLLVVAEATNLASAGR